MSAESVATGVAARLEALLPETLRAREVAADADPVEWQAEPTVTPHQVDSLTTFPAVEVVVTGDTVTGHEMTDSGEVLDAVTYALRIFGTVHGPDYALTDAMRKRLVAAIRELMITPGMPGRVDRRLRASYSRIGTDMNRRTLASGFVDCQLTVLEDPLTPPVGPVLGEDGEPLLTPYEIQKVVVEADRLTP